MVQEITLHNGELIRADTKDSSLREKGIFVRWKGNLVLQIDHCDKTYFWKKGDDDTYYLVMSMSSMNHYADDGKKDGLQIIFDSSLGIFISGPRNSVIV